MSQALSHRIGIEFISVFALPPVEFVNLAADLGCQHIGMMLNPMADNPHRYPAWSLKNDAGLRRDMIKAMRDRDVSISLGEGFFAIPGRDIRNAAADLELMSELGVKRICTLSVGGEQSFAFDQFALLAEMTGALGMEMAIEFGPCLGITDLWTAAAAVQHVNKPNTRLVIDTMHLYRSGSTASDLLKLGLDKIGYVQLCDVPVVSTQPSYVEEAKYERMVPGTGELPLIDVLKILPPHIVIGLEVPQRAKALAGVGPRERLGECVTAAQALLARVN
jgi:sugar phosphate isomerase/epimerase